MWILYIKSELASRSFKQEDNLENGVYAIRYRTVRYVWAGGVM
jgi:hypothetical protein